MKFLSVRYILWLPLTALLWFPCGQVPSLAQRAIPDDNLSYPVLVLRGDGGTGSAFYVNTSTSMYLITAKHVLFDLKTGNLNSPTASFLSYPRDPKENGRNMISADLAMLFKTGEVKPHSTQDVVIVRIASLKEPVSPGGAKAISLVTGLTLKEMAETGIVGVGFENIKKFDEVLVANSIVVFGYPTSLGLKNIPQLDPLRPLLRNGIVAGANPEKKLIVIDCPLYPETAAALFLKSRSSGCKYNLRSLALSASLFRSIAGGSKGYHPSRLEALPTPVMES